MCQPRRPCGRSALQRGLETGRRSQGLREFLPCGRKAAHIRGQRTIGGGKSPEPAGGWTGGLGPAGSPSPPGPARSPSSTNTPQSILGRQGLLFPHQKKKKTTKNPQSIFFPTNALASQGLSLCPEAGLAPQTRRWHPPTAPGPPPSARPVPRTGPLGAGVRSSVETQPFHSGKHEGASGTKGKVRPQPRTRFPNAEVT